MEAIRSLKISDSGEKAVHTSFIFLPSSCPSSLGSYALECKLGESEKLKTCHPGQPAELLTHFNCLLPSFKGSSGLIVRKISYLKKTAPSHLYRKCLYSRVVETRILPSVLPLFLHAFDRSIQSSLSSISSSESSPGSLLSVRKKRRLRGGAQLIT